MNYEHDKGYVHCSHYVSRGIHSTRYHPQNAFCHCYSCHEKLGGGRWGGGNHAEFAHHYDEVFGPDTREFIRQLSLQPFRKHKQLVLDIADYYRDIYNQMEEIRRSVDDSRIEFEFYDGSVELNQFIEENGCCG